MSKKVKGYCFIKESSVVVQPRIRIYCNDLERAQFIARQKLCGEIASFKELKELDTEALVTGFDKPSHNEYSGKQYLKGIRLGNTSESLMINRSGTWTSWLTDGSLTVSYEVIGYHAHTKELIEGVIETGLPIVDLYNYFERMEKNGQV